MTTVTENDIKRVEDKIDKLADDLSKLTEAITANQKLIETRFNDVEKNQIKLENELKGDIKALNETVKGIDKRLDNIEILNRLVSGGVIVGILLTLVKYLFFSNTNI